MTSPVISVAPHTLVSELARVLFERRISAVPVVDGEKLAGIVSERDLLQRYEIETDCALRTAAPWWLRAFVDRDAPAAYVRSHARYVRDIMTRQVLSVAPDTPLADVAHVLEKRRIKRVPVLEAKRVTGIVSRSDIVRALASAATAGAASGAQTDDAIRQRVLDELQRHRWWHSGLASVTVEDGVVAFAGFLDSEDERKAAHVAAETVPGVRAVEDHRMPYAAFSAV
ncbi:MAG: CBS domain-containing protein [Betaproteobacteria bacterium]